MKKLLIVLTILFSVNSLSAIEVGHKAINFTGTTVDGKTISLDQYKGKKAVWIIFWATWCPYCEKEIPALKEVYKEYGDKIEIIGVNIGVRDDMDSIEAYQMEHDIPYSLIMSNDVAREYGVRGTPTQVIIDIHGTVMYKGTRAPSNVGEKTVNALIAK